MELEEIKKLDKRIERYKKRWREITNASKNNPKGKKRKQRL